MGPGPDQAELLRRNGKLRCAASCAVAEHSTPKTRRTLDGEGLNFKLFMSSYTILSHIEIRTDDTTTLARTRTRLWP